MKLARRAKEAERMETIVDGLAVLKWSCELLYNHRPLTLLYYLEAAKRLAVYGYQIILSSYTLLHVGPWVLGRCVSFSATIEDHSLCDRGSTRFHQEDIHVLCQDIKNVNRTT